MWNAAHGSIEAFSFSACGDDDDDEDQPASIVGTQWYSANDVNGQNLSYTIFSFRQGGMLDAEHLIIENGKWSCRERGRTAQGN